MLVGIFVGENVSVIKIVNDVDRAPIPPCCGSVVPGRHIDQKDVNVLDDHAALRQLPAGTLAHAYCDFMEREGLSAQGLVDELDKYRRPDQYFDDQATWYFDRVRDTHDLMHIISGFGRDALGEQCVLAFTYAQNRNLGVGFIAYAGGLELKYRVAKSAPILKSVQEGYRIGNAAKNIVHEDIASLLREPLTDARARLGISEPVTYRAAHEAMRSGGIDPYNLLAPVAA